MIDMETMVMFAGVPPAEKRIWAVQAEPDVSIVPMALPHIGVDADPVVVIVVPESSAAATRAVADAPVPLLIWSRKSDRLVGEPVRVADMFRPEVVVDEV